MDERRLEHLIEQAKDGDTEAAGELAKLFEGSVRTSIRRRLGPEIRNRVETDDIFQSAIADSLREISKFRYGGENAFRAWLSSVAQRKVIDAVRYHRAGKRDVRRDRTVREARHVPGKLTSPIQGAVRGEVTESIRRAVERLPPEERRSVELRSYEGLTFREVAERLELPDKDAARNLFKRAIKRMGDLFESGE